MIALMATIVAIFWKGRRCDRPCHSPDNSGRRPRSEHRSRLGSVFYLGLTGQPKRRLDFILASFMTFMHKDNSV
jgi:hypothetical protein